MVLELLDSLGIDSNIGTIITYCLIISVLSSATVVLLLEVLWNTYKIIIANRISGPTIFRCHDIGPISAGRTVLPDWLSDTSEEEDSWEDAWENAVDEERTGVILLARRNFCITEDFLLMKRQPSVLDRHVHTPFFAVPRQPLVHVKFYGWTNSLISILKDVFVCVLSTIPALVLLLIVKLLVGALSSPVLLRDIWIILLIIVVFIVLLLYLFKCLYRIYIPFFLGLTTGRISLICMVTQNGDHIEVVDTNIDRELIRGIPRLMQCGRIDEKE